MYERAIAIYEETLDPTHPNIANSLYSLAGLYEVQDNKHGEAEALYKRALLKRTAIEAIPLLYRQQSE